MPNSTLVVLVLSCSSLWSGLVFHFLFFLSIAILCIEHKAIGKRSLGVEVQLETPEFGSNQKWSLIQDMEFTDWVKIKNQHGYYLVAKGEKKAVIGGIIKKVFI